MITIEKSSEEKIAIANVTRRSFLQGALSASAFVLCVGKASLLARTEAAGVRAVATPGTPSIDATAFHPSVFLGIQPDGTVLIVAHRTEMGNGVRTSLPRIIADELDADWSRVEVIQGDGDPRYGSQDTDGSHSVREFFDTLREAGATILFLAPGFYHGAETVENLVDFIVARALDQLGLDHALTPRWGQT